MRSAGARSRPPAAYVGLVASRKRAESVLGYLRDRGVSDGGPRARPRARGLDLGKVQPNEIAGRDPRGARYSSAPNERYRSATAEPTARHEEIDPVCGMTVDVADARFRTTHEGRTYYFCSAGCMATFEADPVAYAVSATNTGQ